MISSSREPRSHVCLSAFQLGMRNALVEQGKRAAVRTCTDWYKAAPLMRRAATVAHEEWSRSNEVASSRCWRTDRHGVLEVTFDESVVDLTRGDSSDDQGHADDLSADSLRRSTSDVRQTEIHRPMVG